MRFEIQKHTKRGIDCFERLGKLYAESETKQAVKTPSCTLFLSSGKLKLNKNIVF